MRIALSVCHHKDAPGAVNKHYDITEYQVGRIITTVLASLLKEDGHEIFLTEGKLSHKVNEINSWKPDLAFEVHQNADNDHLDPEDLDDSRGLGCMTLFYPSANTYAEHEPMSPQKQDAENLNSSLSTYMGQKNLGARPGWYWGSLDSNGNPTHKDYFLRKTACRSFILEPGYIDNNKYAKRWLLDGGFEKLAQAIHFAISLFLKDK